MISKADNLHPIYMELADVHGSKGDRGNIVANAHSVPFRNWLK